MTTKKQRRAQVAAKRERFEAELKRSNLASLQKERENRLKDKDKVTKRNN